MAGQLWIPGAERLTPSAPGGTSDYPAAGPRGVVHTTECPSGGRPGEPDYWFWAMARVLKSKSAEPQVLYDPLTDKLGQFFPLNVTGRALANDGGKRTNRVGRVCVQIEVVGYAARPFTRTWKPGKNFESLMKAIGSWRVPQAWPSGRPPAYPTGSDERSRAIWYSKAGWYGHSHVPGNFHGDPGAIDVRAFFAAGESRPDTWVAWPDEMPPRDKMGASKGSNADVNLLIKAALIVHGFSTKMTGEITPKWDKATNDNLEAFKKDRGIEEKGIGSKTWAALGKLPKDAPDFPGPKAFELGKSTPSSLTGQSLLALQGFGRVLDNKLTREWRPRAQRALRRFQLSEPRLEADADGEWGPRTWKLAWTDND